MGKYLSFKLYDRWTKQSESVPIAGLLAPEKTSARVSINDMLAPIYNKDLTLIKSVDSAYKTPFPFDGTFDVTAIQDDIIVSTDPFFNICYELPATTFADNKFRVVYAGSGIELPRIKIQYKWPDQLYYDKPASSETQTVRILFNDEDAVKDALIIYYTSVKNNAITTNSKRLINQLEPIFKTGVDWLLNYDASDLKLNITAVSGQLVATTIYVKQNAFNRPCLFMPTYGWYNTWYPFIRRGSLVTASSILSTRYTMPTEKPSRLVKGARAQLITRTLIKVGYQDIDLTKPVTVRFDGVAQDTIISAMTDVNARFGVITLNKPIPANTSCTVDFEINSDRWIEMVGVDFNPHYAHSSGKSIHTINSISVTYMLQSLSQGGELLYSTSDDPARAFYYINGVESSIRMNASWIKIASIHIAGQAKPQFSDIRKVGGGLDNAYKDEVSWKDFTDWGFYDGQPVDNVAIVVHIPYSVYLDVFGYYVKELGLSSDAAHERAEQYISDGVHRFAPSGVNIIIEYKGE
ncbi:hypothetical protein [Acinetobacter sp.]|uniref:hypothetical protein n=1 Tax=Acinetobacter sp. TaxID=472 RepID=UPI003D053BF9